MYVFSACGCNAEGSISYECNKNGQCQCKANIGGSKCDHCVDNTFGFPNCAGELTLSSTN